MQNKNNLKNMQLILDLGRQSKSPGMVIFWYSDTKQIFHFLFLENYLSPSSPTAYWRAHLESILQQIRAYVKYILQGMFSGLAAPRFGLCMLAS